jgi:hypothetical protein
MNMIAAARREKIEDRGGRTARAEQSKEGGEDFQEGHRPVFPRSTISKIS